MDFQIPFPVGLQLAPLYRLGAHLLKDRVGGHQGRGLLHQADHLLVAAAGQLGVLLDHFLLQTLDHFALKEVAATLTVDPVFSCYQVSTELWDVLK